MPRLATLDNDLSAPESRLGDAQSAYNYVYDLVQADLLRSDYRTYVQGLIDGNAPYAKAKRDRTNLNFRQATAIITQFKMPYTDLLTEVPLLWNVRTAFGRSEEQSDWSQIISEEYHRLTTTHQTWDETMQQAIGQMLVHNIGHLIYTNRLCWMPRPARMNEVLVADQSSCQLEDLDAVVVRKGYITTQLMRFIEDEGHAAGWNVRAVKEAIKDAYYATSMPPDRVNTFEWFQQKRKNGDLYFGTFECERAWTAQVAVREYDGRISTNMIRTDKQVNTYLHQDRDAYDSLDELLNPFFYDIGDGTWHSGRGIGTEIFPYCQIFNKLRCREVDAAFVAASVLVQARDGDAAKRAQMLTLDNLKIIPEGLSFIEHAIGQNIQATVDVRRDMEAGMNNNIGGLMKAPGGPNPRKGQKQAILEMQQAAQLGKGKINQFYSYLDRLGRTMFKKATNPALKLYPNIPGAKEALAFVERCLKRGVPIEALQEIDFVRAYRSAGAGSAVNALMALEALMEIAPSLKEPGREALLRLYVSRLLGSQTADMLCGEIKTGDKQTDDGWQAEVENAQLRQGADGAKFFLTKQDHVIHASSHIADMSDHLKEMEAIASQRELQLEDLMPVHTHLESAGPHAFEHLQQIKSDPMRKGDYTSLNKQWQQIARMGDQITHNIQQMQEERAREAQQQAAQGPQISREDLVKLAMNKDLPESMKQQISQMLGVPAGGQPSVASQNLSLKGAQLQLKQSKQRQDGVLKDIEAAQGVEKHQKEMAAA